VSPERTAAYRRVILMLDQLGPSKLWLEEQETIRYAADSLLFSVQLSADDDALEALEEVGRLCRELVDSGRWEQGTATQLTDELCQCGPAPEAQAELEAA
jgi:hypothetical protein